MRVALIILLVALALPSLLVLSEYNHTLRRGLFYTAWKVAEVYERIKPTELYQDLSPRTRAFYRLFFLNKPTYSTLEESRANVLRSEALILPRSSVKFYPATIRNVSVYWFEPEEYNPNNIIIYNHGGAFILGSARAESYAAGELAHRAKARVVSVNYRLLPEATLEQAIEDVVTVYKYILEEMHIKATNVIPFGCSAGGMLTLMTLQMIKTHHKDLPLPVAAATLAPGPGLEYAIDIPFLEWKSARIPQEENIILPRELGMLVQKYVYHWHNLETDTFHENKNSHTAKELLRDFNGLPPLYVSSGELDVLRDGVIKFAELLKKENVPVDFSIQNRMIHCAASMAQFIDEGHNELDVIAQWMNDKFKN